MASSDGSDDDAEPARRRPHRSPRRWGRRRGIVSPKQRRQPQLQPPPLTPPRLSSLRAPSEIIILVVAVAVAVAVAAATSADAFQPPAALPAGRSRILSVEPKRTRNRAGPKTVTRAAPLRLAQRAGENVRDGAEAAPSDDNVWERLALSLVPGEVDPTDPSDLRRRASAVTLLRVGFPAFLVALAAAALYAPLADALAARIDDSGVFFVVSQDSSQYIQNILTTCGLMFSILVGQTYYFMYQQQEAVYYALFEEVTVAKSLLEQVSLMSQGRAGMYSQILESIERYVDHDLKQLKADPAVLLSARPEDDPLETIMYMTSVGEPSVVYDTVRSLRQARAKRLGALQRKLPPIHMILLWTLAGIVLCTFPLLGAGVQTIGGPGILRVQSVYLSFIVFGVVMTLGIIDELRKPATAGGAYNVDPVLEVMVWGLDDELHGRLEGRYSPMMSASPTVDPDPTDEVVAAVEMAAAAMGWAAAGRPAMAPGGIGTEAEMGADFSPDDGRFEEEDDDGDAQEAGKGSGRRKGLFRRFRRGGSGNKGEQ